MTAQQIAHVVLRLLGVLWLVSGLMSLPQVLSLSSMQGPESGRALVIGAAVTSVLWIALGIALYVLSNALAKLMFPNGNASSLSVDTSDMLQVGFVLVAVYLGIDALGRVAGLLFTVSQHEPWQTDSPLAYVWNTKREALLAASVELIACVALFLGSRGLARVARAVRSMPDRAA